MNSPCWKSTLITGSRITTRPTAAGMVMNETMRSEKASVDFISSMAPAAA